MATMAKPNALAIPRRLTAVGPDPMPPTTPAPQPKKTSAKLPKKSASWLFTGRPLFSPAKNSRCLIRPRRLGKGGAPHFGPLVHGEFLRLPANGGIANL